MAVLNCLY